MATELLPHEKLQDLGITSLKKKYLFDFFFRVISAPCRWDQAKMKKKKAYCIPGIFLGLSTFNIFLFS